MNGRFNVDRGVADMADEAGEISFDEVFFGVPIDHFADDPVALFERGAAGFNQDGLVFAEKGGIGDVVAGRFLDDRAGEVGAAPLQDGDDGAFGPFGRHFGGDFGFDGVAIDRFSDQVAGDEDVGAVADFDKAKSLVVDRDGAGDELGGGFGGLLFRRWGR